MGIRTPPAATPPRHHEQTGQPPILPPLELRFDFGLRIIARGFVDSESRERFQSGMGPTHSTGMGHHHIGVTPVEYGASTLATLGAEFGVSKGSRNCKRPRVSNRDFESEIFLGFAKPIMSHASCAGLFKLKSCSTSDGSRRRGIAT